MASVNKDLLYSQSRFAVEISNEKLKLDLGFFTQVQGLSSQMDVMEYPEGGQNSYVHRLPTRIKQTNLTLKRGITKEGALLNWLQQTLVEVEPTEITIKLMDSYGKTVRSWSFAGAFPVKWTGPDANAGGNEIMTETLEIAHQGAVEVASQS